MRCNAPVVAPEWKKGKARHCPGFFFFFGFEAGRSLAACIGFARQSNLGAESN